jgi:hypothetical protein
MPPESWLTTDSTRIASSLSGFAPSRLLKAKSPPSTKEQNQSNGSLWLEKPGQEAICSHLSVHSGGDFASRKLAGRKSDSFLAGLIEKTPPIPDC